MGLSHMSMLVAVTLFLFVEKCSRTKLQKAVKSSIFESVQRSYFTFVFVGVCESLCVFMFTCAQASVI